MWERASGQEFRLLVADTRSLNLLHPLARRVSKEADLVSYTDPAISLAGQWQYLSAMLGLQARPLLRIVLQHLLGNAVEIEQQSQTMDRDAPTSPLVLIDLWEQS